MKRLLTLLVVLSLFLPAAVRAVDFQEELQKLAQDNATGYIGPFATAFGTAMNSGLYNTAKVHGILGFDIGAKVSLLQVADEDLTFDFLFPVIPFTVTNPGDNSSTTLDIDLNQFYPNRATSTVFGSAKPDSLIADPTVTDGIIRNELSSKGWDPTDIDNFMSSAAGLQLVSDVNGRVPKVPGIPGIGLDFFPLVMPQASVGLPFQTEIMVRFIPEVDVPNIGKLSFLGLGVKHNLSQYIPVPMFPVNISGQFAWQQLDIGDVISSGHTAFNIEASKKLGIPGLSFTPYVGMGIESSTLDISYTIANSGNPLLDGNTVAFDLKGDNSFRMTGGVRFQLTMIAISADYSMGKYNAASLGVGLSLR